MSGIEVGEKSMLIISRDKNVKYMNHFTLSKFPMEDVIRAPSPEVDTVITQQNLDLSPDNVMRGTPRLDFHPVCVPLLLLL